MVDETPSSHHIWIVRHTWPAVASLEMGSEERPCRVICNSEAYDWRQHRDTRAFLLSWLDCAVSMVVITPFKQTGGRRTPQKIAENCGKLRFLEREIAVETKNSVSLTVDRKKSTKKNRYKPKSSQNPAKKHDFTYLSSMFTNFVLKNGR